MKTTILKKLFLFLILIGIYACSTDNSGGGSANTTGTFIAFGVTYTGMCNSNLTVSGCGTGIDVVITPSPEVGRFEIFNMPEAPSGTFPFEDAGSNGIGVCSIVGFNTLDSPVMSSWSVSGSITKTGAKSFTFSCNLIDGITQTTYPVTGSGNY